MRCSTCNLAQCLLAVVQLDDASGTQQQAIVAVLAKAEAQSRAEMRQHVIENQQQLLERAAQTSDLRGTAADLAEATGALLDEVQGTHERMNSAYKKVEEAAAELQAQRDALVVLRAAAAAQQRWSLVTRLLRGPGGKAAADDGGSALDVPAAIAAVPVHSLVDLSAAIGKSKAALAVSACQGQAALAGLKLQVQAAADAVLTQCTSRLKAAVDTMNTTEISMLLLSAHSLGGLLPLVAGQLAELADECSAEAKRAFNTQRISGALAAHDSIPPAFPPQGEREAWCAALWDSGVERCLAKLGSAATKVWLLQQCMHNSESVDSGLLAAAGAHTPRSLLASAVLQLLMGGHKGVQGGVLPHIDSLPTNADGIGPWLPGASTLGLKGLWGLWWGAVTARIAEAVTAVPRSGFVFDELTEQYPRLRVALSDCLSGIQRSCSSRLTERSGPSAAAGRGTPLHTALQRAASTLQADQFDGRMLQLCQALSTAADECHQHALGACALSHARALYSTVDRFASAFIRAREDEMLALAATSVQGSAQPVLGVADPHTGMQLLHGATQEHFHGSQECEGHVPTFADVTAIVKACSSALMSSPGDGVLLYELSTSVQRATLVFCLGTLRLAGGASTLRTMGAHWQPTPQQRCVCALLTRVQQLATGLRQSVDAAVKRAMALSAGSQGVARGAFFPSGPQAEAAFSGQLQGAAAAATADVAVSAAECVPGSKVLLVHVWQPASSLLAIVTRCLVTSYCSGLRSGLLSAAAGVSREGYNAQTEGGGAVQEEAQWVRQLQQACASASKYHLAAFPAEGGLRDHVSRLLAAQVRHGVLLLAASQQGLQSAARMQLAQDVALAEACLVEHFGPAPAASTAAFTSLRRLLQASEAQLCVAASASASALQGASDEAQESYPSLAQGLPLDCLLLVMLSRTAVSLPHEMQSLPASEWAARHVTLPSPVQRAESMLLAAQRCIEEVQPASSTGAEKAVEVTCVEWLRASAPAAVQQLSAAQDAV